MHKVLWRTANAVENDRVAESEEYQQRLRSSNKTLRARPKFSKLPRAGSLSRKLQVQLSDQFEANEVIIADKREVLEIGEGDLNELFGTLQGVAGDFLSNFQDSLISAVSGRTGELEVIIERAGSSIEQLNISEMERFWYFMHQEVTESAVSSPTVGKLPCPAVRRRLAVTRIGSFNAFQTASI